MNACFDFSLLFLLPEQTFDTGKCPKILSLTGTSRLPVQTSRALSRSRNGDWYQFFISPVTTLEFRPLASSKISVFCSETSISLHPFNFEQDDIIDSELTTICIVLYSSRYRCGESQPGPGGELISPLKENHASLGKT